MLTGLVMGLPSLWLAKKAGFIDLPQSAPHKRHSKPTPLAGGIALVLSVAVLIGLSNAWVTREIGGLLLGSLVVWAFGLLDDRLGFSALKKLGGQFLAVVIAIFFNVYVQIFGSPEFLSFQVQWMNTTLNILITTLWFVGITNAFNLIDSMDGLTLGISAITLTFFVMATLISAQPPLTTLSVLLLGVSVGLYPWNRTPARFFLGDSGAQTLGYMIAGIAILYTPLFAKGQASSWFTPILFLAIPIFDTCLVVYARLRHGQPVYQGSNDHTYHRLVSLGISPLRTTTLIHVTALLIDCIAFGALFLNSLPANLVFFTLLVTGGILLVLLEKKTEGI
ncbi:MAG: undecaprenyl/decaprenyl-phosphate alpha-N-acetylglucosaminyl 1-phosphate transferase [Anaerolineales bacterium]